MHFKMSSAVCFNLDLSKTLSFGNELNMFWFNDNADDDLATTSILYLSVYCKTTPQKCCPLVTKWWVTCTSWKKNKIKMVELHFNNSSAHLKPLLCLKKELKSTFSVCMACTDQTLHFYHGAVFVKISGRSIRQTSSSITLHILYSLILI